MFIIKIQISHKEAKNPESSQSIKSTGKVVAPVKNDSKGNGKTKREAAATKQDDLSLTSKF